MTPAEPIISLSITDQLDSLRIQTQNALDRTHQLEMGQFFTPPVVARMMSGMFRVFPERISLVDPGAGVGTLSAAFVERAVFSSPRPKRIKVTAFEVDPLLFEGLKITLRECQKLCLQNNIEFQFEIHQEDFVRASVDFIKSIGSLFPVNQPDYNFAIINPPYKKISSNSHTRRLLNSIGIETTNLYSAFLWLVMKTLKTGGEFVAIVPRSFCNGTYFRPFRSDLLSTMAINRIHIFSARDKIFQEGSVLQENIILHATKTSDREQKIIITSSDDPEDEDLIIQQIDYDQLVRQDDPEKFIRIVRDQLGHQISTQINDLPCTLKDLGITVSTGRVVDFRVRQLLKTESDEEFIPLIYPNNLRQGYVFPPLPDQKKPGYLTLSDEIENLAIPAQPYVFVKRFSSKEEKRRVYAAIYDPARIPAKRIGVENHINYFHRRYGGLSIDMAKGLAIYLNSTLVDQYFRQFSGHTQVNASDLRNMKYPTEKQLTTLGKKVREFFPTQDEIDDMIMEELMLNENNGDASNNDPIQAKKKIREALTILQALNVPRAQQNDRSALTLLSLVNMRASMAWYEASENLIGITEMMDFFREHYGIKYAPNTRETVRRQTIHQFIQLGLVVPNPDDPTRPINSPKTRYIIEKKILELVRSFGSTNWEGNLRHYIQSAVSLEKLQVRERTMPMVPVMLPNGEKIMLSSGGQNDLIKKIIEEFCPRFTPGGKLVYIGDAGEKLNEKEYDYLERLGIEIDKHGKMPDVIIDLPEKQWLVLIEAVTSHGPIDLKRHNELKEIFLGEKYGLVFVTAFETRKAMNKFLSEIAWETEVWVAEAPSHLIHFNGERFLGPY